VGPAIRPTTSWPTSADQAAPPDCTAERLAGNEAAPFSAHFPSGHETVSASIDQPAAVHHAADVWPRTRVSVFFWRPTTPADPASLGQA